jgi:hypothetical protein
MFFLSYHLNAIDNNSTKINYENMKVDDIVIDGIKNNECFKYEGKCDPYVIRLNNPLEIQLAIDNNITLEKNLLKCINQENCVLKAKELISLGINNFDNGAYQINYKYNPILNIEEYFNESQARLIVNNILINLIKKWGYSWETIGRYHHSPESDYNRNMNYYIKISDYIVKIQNKQNK